MSLAAEPIPMAETGRRRPWLAPAAVALGSLLLHGLVALLHDLPGVFRKYGLAAEQHLSGELPAERLMDFSPLYFHLSVAAELLLPQPARLMEGLQIALVAASLGLLFHLLRRRFSPRLAAVAVVVMAFDRHLLIYERLLEPEALLVFLLVAFLFFVDRRRGGAAWLAGCCAALCLATRPTFLPAFLLVPLYFKLRGDGGRAWRRRCLAFLAPVAAVLVLLALRAWAVTGDPRTPVMNPGTVFFEGNNPASRGTSAIYPPVVVSFVRHAGRVPDSAHQHYRTVARAATGRELSIAEVNAFWASHTWAFLRAEPRRAARLLLDKLVRAFHGFRWHDVPTAWRYEQLLFFVPALPFALLSALALVGALLEVRRWRESLLYFALGGAQLAVMLAFYVSARQRMVLLPALVYFAAVAVEHVLAERRRAWPWLLLVVLLLLPLTTADAALRADEIYKRRGFAAADQLLHEVREKSREAPLAWHAELAVEAVAAAPWWLEWMRPAYFPRHQGTLEERVAALLTSRPRRSVSADFDLAAIHLQAGQLEAARRLLEPLAEAGATVYRGGRQPSLPRLLLARTLALSGEQQRAVELLEEAHERTPGNPFVLAELVALTNDPTYQEPLLAYWSPLDAQYLLGRALRLHGRPQEASAALGFVVRRLPSFRDARVFLAAALGASGHDEDAVRHYLEATHDRPEPILAADDIVALFRRWAATHPERGDVQLTAAQVLHRHGHFEEALALLERLEPPEELRGPVEGERARIRRALRVE